MKKDQIVPPDISDEEFHSKRADILNQGVRGLMILNGGGAVALLAFLQAIWKDEKDLAFYIVWGIAILTIGAFFSGLINLSRYNTSLNAQSYFKALKMEPCEEKEDGVKYFGIRFHAWQNITQFCQVMSYATFILGFSVVVIGALVLLAGK